VATAETERARASTAVATFMLSRITHRFSKDNGKPEGIGDAPIHWVEGIRKI
jgi:hypothetical protein